MAKFQKITPFLWFDNQAEEAANFYVSLFKNAKVKGIARNGDKVMTVGFELEGQSFTALNGGPMFKFTEAVSFVVHCKSQQEVDYFWEKLIAGGGMESQCGWLKDKYGLSWQIVPDVLIKLLSDPDPEKAQRVMAAMMEMRKIDIAKLKRAQKGQKKTKITVKATVNAPIAKVWKLWTEPAHIKQWNNASDDWHTPQASNDLRTGGSFSCTMAAKDGSFSFEFGGVYDDVQLHKLIAYTMGDGRQVWVHFEEKANKTLVTEVFETESTHSHEMQRSGWQAILDNFKKYTEANA